MERRSRALEDQDTLLTLPLSDFPNNTSSATTTTNNNNNKDDDDDLILIALPPKKDGGLTMEDLIRGKSVYILGNTSEKDVHKNNNLHPSVAAVVAEQQQQDDNDNNGSSNVGGSIEPIAARLIVEGQEGGSGKTLELTRVETSNTYIVVPPMLCKKNGEDKMDGDDDDGISGNNGSNKRQKLLDSNSSANTTNKSNDELEKNNKKLITMPARSVGLVPGEESPATFFLDPLHLQPGHFASKLRASLSRWMYDPFDPPVVMEGSSEEGNNKLMFGYTIPELAHICRTSQSEIEYAIHNRIYGAVDALAIPSSSSTNDNTNITRRYGMLSEEGRQTVAMAIVTTLLESDLDLVWKFPPSTSSSSEEKDNKEQTTGMQLSLLMEEIRSHWHSLEGNQDDGAPSSSQPQQLEEGPHLTDSQSQNFDSQSQFGTPSQFPPTNDNNHQSLQLADEIIWHCLRPILHYDVPPATSTTTKDTMPEMVQLIPDEVAKLAAHHVFLRGTPRSLSSASSSQQQIGTGSAVWWEEEEFMEAWSMRLPSMSSKYEPRVELLKGVAICGMKEVDSGEDGKQQVRQWQYFPETGQSLALSIRIKSMFANARCMDPGGGFAVP